MIVDLHSHYPMHILARDGAPARARRRRPRGLRERIQRAVLRLANRVANYPGEGRRAAVTSQSLAESNVRVALSVLYLPFAEMDFALEYGAPPEPHYFADLMALLNHVNRRAERDRDLVAVATDRPAIDAINQSGRVALVHAVEGGFHIGLDDATIRANVASLAAAGVAYITVAHLFWRRVATNSPAVTLLPDPVYHWLFPQPHAGLCPLGRTLVTAMIDLGILIDVTHMSRAAIADTLALLDRYDPGQTIPLLAGHTACREIHDVEYNLADDHLAAIIRRNGVIGLIACSHWMAPGGKRTRSFEQTIEVLCRHIDHIESVARRMGARHDHHYSAIGSDQDGFIKPPLHGLEFPAGYKAVEAALIQRYPNAWERICSRNALRVLDSWGKRP